VLLISPALLFPSPARMLLALLVPLTWICHKHLGGRVIPATPLNAPIIVLLVMTGVSVLATFDIVFNLGKVSGLLLGVLLFWAITRWMTTSDRLRTGTAMFMAAGAALAVIGLLGTNWINKFSALSAIIARIPGQSAGYQAPKKASSPTPLPGASCCSFHCRRRCSRPTPVAGTAAGGVSRPRWRCWD